MNHLDGFSALLVVATTLIALMTIVAPRPEAVPPRVFYPASLALPAGLLGAFAARDPWFIFAGWQVAVAALWWLIRFEPGSRRRATVNAAAAVQCVSLLAVLLVMRAAPLSPRAGWSAFLALAIAAAATSALFTLCGRVIGAPLGAYGIVRIGLPLLPEAARSLAPFLGVAFVAAMLIAAVATIRARTWGDRVAAGAAGQMAMALLGAVALNPLALTGSMVVQITQGLSIAGLMRLTEPAAVSLERSRLVRALASVLALAAAGLPAFSGFVGAFLVLQGTASVNAAWAAGGAGALALSAAGLLHGSHLALRPSAAGDATAVGRGVGRLELGVLVPVTAAAVWLGVSPAPLLARLAGPVQQVVARVDPAHPKTAAECDTTVTPEMKAANPAAQFLEAAPCGPDGQPLPQGGGSKP